MTRRRCTGAIALVSLSLGCRGRPAPVDDQTPAPAPVATASSEQPPVDHLAPDELLEGTQVALGVTLPRDLRLEGAFDNAAYARGTASVHSLVQYFRARLHDGGLREGETSATFEHVHAPARPGHELNVHIGTTLGGVRVELRDTTPAIPLSAADDEARLRQVGLTRDGRWIDPLNPK